MYNTFSYKFTLIIQDVRGRYRYLSHLPLTCEFVPCELDLRPPILSQRHIQDILRGSAEEKTEEAQEKERREGRERKREPNLGKQYKNTYIPDIHVNCIEYANVELHIVVMHTCTWRNPPPSNFCQSGLKVKSQRSYM